MSIFGTILTKLGLKKDTAAEDAKAMADRVKAEAEARDRMLKQAAKPATSAPAAKPAVAASQPAAAPVPATPPPAAPAPAAPKPISEVDVVKQLEAKAKGSGLDWKVSIVDLLKLLDIDSSREARNELAQELGCPSELMKDSAKMNVWLHKTVLKKIAENGGNIPKDLLD